MEQILTNENNQMKEIRKKEARPFYTPKDGTSMFLWTLLGSFVLSFVLSLVYLSISSGMELKIEKFLNLKPVIFINAFVMQLFFIVIYFVFFKIFIFIYTCFSWLFICIHNSFLCFLWGFFGVLWLSFKWYWNQTW